MIDNVGLLQGKLGIRAHVFSVGVTFWVVLEHISACLQQ